MAKRIKRITRRIKRKARKHGFYITLGFAGGMAVMYFIKPWIDDLITTWFPAPVPPAAVRFARAPIQQIQTSPRAAVAVNPYRTLAGQLGPSDPYSDGSLIFVD